MEHECKNLPMYCNVLSFVLASGQPRLKLSWVALWLQTQWDASFHALAQRCTQTYRTIQQRALHIQIPNCVIQSLERWKKKIQFHHRHKTKKMQNIFSAQIRSEPDPSHATWTFDYTATHRHGLMKNSSQPLALCNKLKVQYLSVVTLNTYSWKSPSRGKLTSKFAWQNPHPHHWNP